MPQIEWPQRRVPCATLALVTNTDHFYVRKDDQKFLPEGLEVRYQYTDGDQSADLQRWVSPYNGDDRAKFGSYQLFTKSNLDPTSLVRLADLKPQFTIASDAGVVVNYPTRPILTAPGLQSNTTNTNPRRVNAYDTGGSLYTGSIELHVALRENAGIVESFIDQLYDPRNWFELPLPGDHLGTATVTTYDGFNGDITIDTDTEDNYHGWWARVGNRTVRIINHSVTTTSVSKSGDNVDFGYAHTIRIVPPLITGTTASNSANNFAGKDTMRVRATSVSASGNADFAGSWVIEFSETDGQT